MTAQSPARHRALLQGLNSPLPAGWSARGYELLRFALAALLMVAAALKAHQLATEPLDHRLWWTVVVAGEWLLAVALLSGLYKKPVRAAALAALAIFAIVTFTLAQQGAASCGCFGTVQVSPWTTLFLDLGLLLALVLLRPAAPGIPGSPGSTRTPGPPATAGRTASGQAPADRVAATTSSWRLGLSGAFALAGAVALAGYASTYVAGSVNPDGTLAGDEGHVQLEPARWQGERFGLMEHIDIRHQLVRGAWTVMLFRHDCSSCTDHLDLLLSERQLRDPAAPRRLAVIELPPYASAGELPALPRGWMYGKLSDARQWRGSTPHFVRLEDGRVQDEARHHHLLLGEAAVARVAQLPANQSARASSEPEPAAELPPRQVTLDLGYVPAATTVQGVVQLRHDGDEPFRIRAIAIACGCTTLPEPPSRFPAGETVELPVRFDPRTNLGPYAKTLTFLPEDADQAPIELTVAARIGQPLTLEPAGLELTSLAPAQQVVEQVTVHNEGDEPVRLLYAISSRPDVIARIPRQATLAPGAVLDLPVAVRATAAAGQSHRATIHLQSSAPHQRSMALPVRFTIDLPETAAETNGADETARDAAGS